MIDRIGNRSKAQGFATSRLPKLTKDEIDFIKGTYDYIGINAYSTYYIKNNPEEANLDLLSQDSDMNVIIFFDDDWEETPSSWIRVVPWGLRKLLNWLDKTYNHPEIFITENGVSDKGGLEDKLRINYYKVFSIVYFDFFFLVFMYLQEFLNNLLDSILDDGINVTRYTAWSLMDNFEWARGYK